MIFDVVQRFFARWKFDQLAGVSKRLTPLWRTRKGKMSEFMKPYGNWLHEHFYDSDF